MADINKLPPTTLRKHCLSIGALPTSYLVSLSYEEQLLLLSQKADEIITFINDILEQKINDYINEKFNDMIIDTMYIPETETLVLYLTQKEV